MTVTLSECKMLPRSGQTQYYCESRIVVMFLLPGVAASLWLSVPKC